MNLFTNLIFKIMKPSPPTKVIWLIGLIAGILGIVGHYVDIPQVSDYSFYLVMAGFVLLALGTTLKGL